MVKINRNTAWEGPLGSPSTMYECEEEQRALQNGCCIWVLLTIEVGLTLQSTEVCQDDQRFIQVYPFIQKTEEIEGGKTTQ